MKTLDKFLSEAKHTTSLLPATKVLWNKNKVGIDDVAKQWPTGKVTVQVAHVHDSYWSGKSGQKPKLRFVVGHGHGGYKNEFEAHHDQNFSNLGHHTIVNNVHLENGKLVHKDNDLHVGDKAPVHVYK